jgi:hypothetical protein
VKRWLYYWFLAPRDQRWFWTKEWQALEAEAHADIAAGRTRTFSSFEELSDYLLSDEEES